MPSFSKSGSTTPHRGRRPTPKLLSSTTTKPIASLTGLTRLPVLFRWQPYPPLQDVLEATNSYSVDNLLDLSMWKIVDIRTLLVAHLHLPSRPENFIPQGLGSLQRWKIFTFVTTRTQPRQLP